MPRLALLTLVVLAAGLGGDEDEPHLDSSITSRDALAQAGIRLLGNPNEAQQRKGIGYFERALADWATPRPYSMDEAQGRMLACLLYTSPSPRDGLLSRMPSSA